MRVRVRPNPNQSPLERLDLLVESDHAQAARAQPLPPLGSAGAREPNVALRPVQLQHVDVVGTWLVWVRVRVRARVRVRVRVP